MSDPATVGPAGGEQEVFRQSFREEAGEILLELETAMLALHDTPQDAQLVGRVFRGLHTIKGSGAMFGFDDLAAFTHELETVFDEVRKGTLLVDADLVDLTLAALDQIRKLLHATPDQGACDDILRRARALMPRAAQTQALVPLSISPADEQAGGAEWRIYFAPGAEMMRNGSDPLLLIKELSGMGRLTATASMDAIPGIADLEPQRCYVSWDMTLQTRAGGDAIRDVFIFVQDQCELTVEPVQAEPGNPQKGSAAAGADAIPTAGDVTAAALARERAVQGGRRAYDKPETASSLRVPAAKLDQLVDLVGELVTVQARLSGLSAQREDGELSAVSEEVERLASALRENSMNMRMLPIRGTFERFRRLVHDLARDLGKDVELTIEGAETELDKTVIEQLSDPLMHLIRNSMDHGIEPPEQRVAAGKPAMATIHLSARHAGASVLIGVSDDGRGIDREAVRKRAIERGLTSEDAFLSDAQIFDFIFHPGFSTAKQVTDLSGRGVGMDVVRKQVDLLRGGIDVASKPGEGTTVTLRLPLTLAIIDGLLVRVADSSFVLPLANTLECIELAGNRAEENSGKHIVNVRGEIVPYIRLREYFEVTTERPAIEQIMLVETEEGYIGLVFDQVLGNCQTVIKSLGRWFRDVPFVSGATILGDGTVALILDPQRLVQEAIRSRANNFRARSPTAPLEALSRATAVAAALS